MPTKDRARLIPLALRSFQNQTHTELELLILDDGKQPISHLIPNDPRIAYIKIPPPPLTLGAKLNALAKLARAPILVNWDDDDWSAPTRIEYQLQHLLTTNKSLTGFNCFHYWDTTTQQAYLWKHPNRNFCPPGATQMYTKAWLLAHPMRNITLPVDLYFGREARTMNQVTEQPGLGFLVARFHGNNSWRTIMRNRYYPRVDKSTLPTQFFADMEIT